MTTKHIFIFLVFIAAFVFAKSKADQRCENIEKKVAALVKPDAKNLWIRYDQLLKKYKPCTDGYFGEGISETNIKWLIQYWDSIEDLNKASTEFKKFLIERVNATLSGDDIEKVQTLAKNKCPKNLKQFCLDLSNKAHEALSTLQN